MSSMRGRRQPAAARWLVCAVWAIAGLGCQQLDRLFAPPEPHWNAIIQFDGLEYVTDGTLAIDARLARLDRRPSRQSPAWFGRAFQKQSVAERRDLFSIHDIEVVDGEAEARGPANLVVDAASMAFLQAKLGGERARMWQGLPMEPLVIVIDGQPIGALRVISQ